VKRCSHRRALVRHPIIVITYVERRLVFGLKHVPCFIESRKFHRSTFFNPNTEFNSDLAPYDFWAFPTMKRELRGKKFRSDQRFVARFREVGGAL
jgi:hypothetical protein